MIWAFQQQVQEVTAVPVTKYGILLALGLAAMTAIQIIIMAMINGWTSSRKEKRDAERAEAAATLAAKLKSEEKAEDWRRQDEVAERVAVAAKQAADAAALLLESQTAAIKKQDQVADQVALAARQLVDAQKATNVRQDQVASLVADAAKQAADAASLLVKAQQETIHRTDEVARIAAENDARVQLQLVAIDDMGKKIHVLVNSDMTAARTAERDSLKLLVISLRNALALSKSLDIKLTGHEDEEIERIEKRLTELDQILADRHAAQKVVDDEAKAQANAQPTVQAASMTAASLKEIAKNTKETADNTARTQETTEATQKTAEKTQKTLEAQK